MFTQSWSISWNNVEITDLANGTVNIDNSVNPQTAQRPINELSILALNLVDPSADYFDMYDASTWNHVRVPAMRPSQASYLADWLNDTRTGSLWTITSGIYAVHDHIHAITRRALTATPVLTAWGTGHVIVSQNLQINNTDEESEEYVLFVNHTITAWGAWATFAIPAKAWYQQPIVTSQWTYRQTGTSTGQIPAPVMWDELCIYAWGAWYVWPLTRSQALTYYSTLHLKYTLS